MVACGCARRSSGDFFARAVEAASLQVYLAPEDSKRWLAGRPGRRLLWAGLAAFFFAAPQAFALVFRKLNWVLLSEMAELFNMKLFVLACLALVCFSEDIKRSK